MIIPIGHGGDVRRIPYITLAIIAVNIILFFLTSSRVNQDNVIVMQKYYT